MLTSYEKGRLKTSLFLGPKLSVSAPFQKFFNLVLVTDSGSKSLFSILAHTRNPFLPFLSIDVGIDFELTKSYTHLSRIILLYSFSPAKVAQGRYEIIGSSAQASGTISKRAQFVSIGFIFSKNHAYRNRHGKLLQN